MLQTVSCLLFVCVCVCVCVCVWLYRFLVAAHGSLVVAYGILVAACGIFSCGMRDLVLWRGIEPGPLALGVLAPGPPGKSPALSFEITCQIMTQVMLILLSFQEKFRACCWDVSGPLDKGPILLPRLPSWSFFPQSVLGASVPYGSPYMP